MLSFQTRRLEKVSSGMKRLGRVTVKLEAGTANLTSSTGLRMWIIYMSQRSMHEKIYLDTVDSPDISGT